MNTFNYWFDYIKRNGEYSPDYKMANAINYSFENAWMVKTKTFSYFALFGEKKRISGKFNDSSVINFVIYDSAMEDFYSRQDFYRELINHGNKN